MRCGSVGAEQCSKTRVSHVAPVDLLEAFGDIWVSEVRCDVSMAPLTLCALKGLFWIAGRTGKAEGNVWWFISGGFSWGGCRI